MAGGSCTSLVNTESCPSHLVPVSLASYDPSPQRALGNWGNAITNMASVGWTNREGCSGEEVRAVPLVMQYD